MKSRPILFSASMVRAILDGRKTMTRRVLDLDTLQGVLPRTVRGDGPFSHVTVPPGKHHLHVNRNFAVSVANQKSFKLGTSLGGPPMLGLRPGELTFLTPHAGECTATVIDQRWELTPVEPARLWVRETWQSLVEHDGLSPSEIPEGSDIQYPATYDGWVSKLRPSIHMPRWASRIELEVSGVRVERLQDITEQDARAEGVESRAEFEALWGQIHGGEAWGANPWVWAYTFARMEMAL